jgi:long-chain fatty acid transport protein
VGYYTTEELTQAANPQFPEIIGTINDHGGGVSFDVSAELEPVTSIPLTIGVDYKHEAKQAMTGEVSNTNTTPALLATVPVLADQNITHDLTFPSVLNVGVSYEPIADLLLSVAWTWTGYSVYQDDLYLGENHNQPIVAGGEEYEAIAEVPRDYGNGNTFRLGVEWDATPRLALRAGVARDLSGMPTADNASVLINTTASPTLPDSHSWTGTVGVAYQLLAGLSLQAAFLYMRMDEKLSPGSEATPQADPYPGVYNARALIGAIGVSWTPWSGEGS